MKIDPNERIIVAGTDTLALGFEITDFKDTLPSPNYHKVDIPGGNGMLNLTESLSGDVTYGNGKHTVGLTCMDDPGVSYEQLITRLSNKLHGRELEYVLSWEPEYTYRGTFDIDSPTNDLFPVVAITIDRDPFKSKPKRTLKANAAGGVVIDLPCGRKRVCPTFDVSGECEIYGKGAHAHFYQAGAYKINDLILEEGHNEIYINTYFGPGTVTWAALAARNITWEQFAKKRFCEWAIDGSDFNVPMRWCDLPVMRWRDFGRVPFDQWRMPASQMEEYNIYIQYEWSDL